MNKIFTLLFCTSLYLPCSAQNAADTSAKLEFVDRSGTVVPDGSEITVHAEQDDFGQWMVPTLLSVRNASGERMGASCRFQIREMPNGSISCCFPTNCETRTAPGSYETQPGIMEKDQTKNFQTEWMPNDYGTTTASFQLMYRTAGVLQAGQITGEGPKVFVRFVYSDPTGIRTHSTPINRVAARFDAAGHRISTPVRGLNILKMEDGSTKKVVLP